MLLSAVGPVLYHVRLLPLVLVRVAFLEYIFAFSSLGVHARLYQPTGSALNASVLRIG